MKAEQKETLNFQNLIVTAHLIHHKLMGNAASKAELAAARTAAEAETQRSLAIRAVRVSGRVGAKSDLMGVYVLDATHSLKRGKNVYSLEGASRVHLYHTADCKWQIGDTEDMVSGEYEGIIESTTASASPLGLEWHVSDGTGFHLDPLLTVTEST